MLNLSKIIAVWTKASDIVLGTTIVVPGDSIDCLKTGVTQTRVLIEGAFWTGQWSATKQEWSAYGGSYDWRGNDAVVAPNGTATFSTDDVAALLLERSVPGYVKFNKNRKICERPFLQSLKANKANSAEI